jgi:prolipoprotein diacylglyceryl transferase
VWHLGPFPLRAYAFCIIAGIIVCALIADRRMRDRGAPQYAILDVAVWAVPAGIIGARIYNVATSWQDYFGAGGTGWLSTLEVWKGGLGIWGAVAGGAFGAWLACRSLGIPLTFVADCLAPALPVAQAIGRFGNWFNNELYGRATSLPWGLKVYQMDPRNPGHAMIGPDGHPIVLGVFQPTFLYEVVWDLGVAVFVFLMDRKFKFGKGRAFALYVMAYTVGRSVVEYLRDDPANHILGLRLNDWTALIVFIAALIYFLRVKGPREILVPADGGFRVVTEAEAAAIAEDPDQDLDGVRATETDADPGDPDDAAGIDAAADADADALDAADADVPDTDGEAPVGADDAPPPARKAPIKPRSATK